MTYVIYQMNRNKRKSMDQDTLFKLHFNGDLDFKTFEEYEEFLSSDFMGENILKAELIDYMIKDDLVYWDYVNFNEKIYMILKQK